MASPLPINACRAPSPGTGTAGVAAHTFARRTLGFVRRSANGFRGSVEFLIASAALELKTARFLSRSGAPLARLDRGERRALQRLLDFTG